MLEPLWSRNYLASVQITMAEDFGVEDRGHFYDLVGALRDVVVNHLIQVVAACAMERGDSTRFTRQDGVEEMWRVMQPLLDAPPPVHPYKPGSWGPDAADELVAGFGKWHEPWLTT